MLYGRAPVVRSRLITAGRYHPSDLSYPLGVVAIATNEVRTQSSFLAHLVRRRLADNGGQVEAGCQCGLSTR